MTHSAGHNFLSDQKIANVQQERIIRDNHSNTLPQFIQKFLKEECPAHSIANVEECKSAQQRVWIVRFRDQPTKAGNSSSDSIGCYKDHNLWDDCLQQGNGRIVVRLWQGGCQWWNLHCNTSPQAVAQVELDGYRSSREAFMKNESSSTITIPRIIHCSFNHKLVARQNDDRAKQKTLPWAILEYVGPKSRYFNTHVQYDSSLVETMVKTRIEFGFEEPHPRWGRVPEHMSLEYARKILYDCVMPIHTYWKTHIIDTKKFPSFAPINTYESMVATYQRALNNIQSNDAKAAGVSSKGEWNEIMSLLKVSIEKTLPENAKQIPVIHFQTLVHMDLQPQNLLFGRRKLSTYDSIFTRNHLEVVSVLDWEDAGMADPRFELLLMARKVCANQDQSVALWEEYSNEMQLNVGPLKPWLELESVHSLLTFFLQSLDNLNGGRSPWETSNDLWMKIKREKTRWHRMRNNKILF